MATACSSMCNAYHSYVKISVKWNSSLLELSEEEREERESLRPKVRTIHPKFYVILVHFNTI